MDSQEAVTMARELHESNVWFYINAGELPEFPPLFKKLLEKELSTRTVKKLTGLTDRQLTDWDHRGAIPVNRESRGGWRRYSPLDVFLLMICWEIRDKFSVPVEKLKFIQKSIISNEPKCIEKLFNAVYIFNLQVFLITDFEKLLLIKPLLEIADMIKKNTFSGRGYEKLIFLNVNRLINKLFKELGLPVPDEEKIEIGRVVFAAQERFKCTQSLEETALLALSRQKGIDKVEVKLADGKIKMLRTSEERGSGLDKNEIMDLIDSADFLNISIRKHNGEIIRITREQPLKFD